MPALILNTGEAWEPEADQIAKWKALYPKVDVDQELNAMAGWLDANPKNRKTARGIARFCNSWLARAQDRGGQGMAKPRKGAIPTRDMSALDDLSHNFTGDPEIRRNFIAKYGQSYEDGERLT